MLTDEMVEAAARAMDAAMAYEVERDVLACDLTREEQRKVATAALTAALPLIRAQVLEEATRLVEKRTQLHLSAFSKAVEVRHDGHQTHYAARNIEAEEIASHLRALKENPNG